MSDPFGHRKYHSLYFILGFLIAVILVSVLSGCERGKDSKGRACTSVVGVGITGDACVPVDVWIEEEIEKERPPCSGWGCNRPTDPPGCWYPESDYCYEAPVNCCMALTPSCMACQEGISVSEWKAKTCGTNACNVEYAGWDNDLMEPIWLCQMIIIN